MEITSIKIRKISDSERMKAIVSITFDDELAVHDIKIIGTPEKLFVAMPSRKINDGEYRDIVHPINSEMREKIESAVIKEYQEYQAREV